MTFRYAHSCTCLMCICCGVCGQCKYIRKVFTVVFKAQFFLAYFVAGAMFQARDLFPLSAEKPLCTSGHLFYVYLLWYFCYRTAVRVYPHGKQICKCANCFCYIMCCVLCLLSAAAIVMLLLPIAVCIRPFTMCQGRRSSQKVCWIEIPKAAAAQRRKASRKQWKDEAAYLKGFRHRSSRCRALLLVWYRCTRWCAGEFSALSEFVYTLHLWEVLVNTVCICLWVAAMLWNVCLLYTSPSPRDKRQSRMPSSA